MSTVRTTLEETFKSGANGVLSVFAHQVCEMVKEEYDVDLTPEKLLDLAGMPYKPPSTPGGLSGSAMQTTLPNIPNYFAGGVSPASATKKRGGRTKKTVDPNLPKCEYKMTRGKTPGKGCEKQVLGDGSLGADKFCGDCLKKAAVKKLLEGSSSKATVQPPQIPGSAVSVEEDSTEKGGELQVVEIQGRPGWYRETNHGFIILQGADSSVSVHSVDDGKNGERDLTESERKIALSLGLQVVNNEVVKVPSLAKNSMPPIPTVPQVPRVSQLNG